MVVGAWGGVGAVVGAMNGVDETVGGGEVEGISGAGVRVGSMEGVVVGTLVGGLRRSPHANDTAAARRHSSPAPVITRRTLDAFMML